MRRARQSHCDEPFDGPMSAGSSKYQIMLRCSEVCIVVGDSEEAVKLDEIGEPVEERALLIIVA